MCWAGFLLGDCPDGDSVDLFTCSNPLPNPATTPQQQRSPSQFYHGFKFQARSSQCRRVLHSPQKESWASCGGLFGGGFQLRRCIGWHMPLFQVLPNHPSQLPLFSALLLDAPKGPSTATRDSNRAPRSKLQESVSCSPTPRPSPPYGSPTPPSAPTPACSPPPRHTQQRRLPSCPGS